MELWRYPVKSMLGERLERTTVGRLGVKGDRAFAVRDQASGRIISAKRLPALFGCSARLDGVTAVTLPDASELETADPDLPARLSEVLGRAVTVVPQGSIEEPRIETGDADTEEGDSDEFDGMPGTFFDAAPVHLLTTSSLRAASALDPESIYDVRRFRPNVLLEAEGDGFVEQDWLGRTISIGEVTLEVSRPCGRCVMTTHAQSELPKERAVLATVARELDNNLGLLCNVASGGELALGEEAFLH